MRDITNRLRAQLDRAVKRQPIIIGAGPSFWDCLAGLTEPADLDLSSEIAEAIEHAANLPSPTPDRYELALQAALDVPYGLRELSPDITITESGDQQ